MSIKTTRIISIVLMAFASAMLLMSSIMKLSSTQKMIDSLGKAGLANYVILFGIIELLSVVLFWIPKTRNIGFFLLCSYLGGALSIELAGGHSPIAALLLLIIWTAVYIKDRSMFLRSSNTQMS